MGLRLHRHAVIERRGRAARRRAGSVHRIVRWNSGSSQGWFGTLEHLILKDSPVFMLLRLQGCCCSLLRRLAGSSRISATGVVRPIRTRLAWLAVAKDQQTLGRDTLGQHLAAERGGGQRREPRMQRCEDGFAECGHRRKPCGFRGDRCGIGSTKRQGKRFFTTCLY